MTRNVFAFSLSFFFIALGEWFRNCCESKCIPKKKHTHAHLHIRPNANTITEKTLYQLEQSKSTKAARTRLLQYYTLPGRRLITMCLGMFHINSAWYCFHSANEPKQNVEKYFTGISLTPEDFSTCCSFVLFFRSSTLLQRKRH